MIGNTVQIRRLARALIEQSFTLLTGSQSNFSQTNYIPELSQDLAIHLCDTIVTARPDSLDVQLGAAKEVFRNYQATPWLLGPFCCALRPLLVAACTSRSNAIKRSQMVTSLARILGIVAHDPAASVAFSSKCLGAAVKADGFFELVINVYLASATAFPKSEHELARLASVFISSPICCPALVSKVLRRLLAVRTSNVSLCLLTFCRRLPPLKRRPYLHHVPATTQSWPYYAFFAVLSTTVAICPSRHLNYCPRSPSFLPCSSIRVHAS